MTPTTAVEQDELKKAWARLRDESPDLRIREAAAQLNVSEAELLATQTGETVTRLEPKFPEILREFPALGRIMALTRNDQIVHERKGKFGAVEVFDGHGKMGLVLGDDIDLRIFFSKWRFAFAVTSDLPRGTQRSFQFFGADGTAVHKVFLTAESDAAVYKNILEKYRAENQNSPLEITPKPEKMPEKLDAEIDVAGFQKAWSELKDTHDFFPLLRKFGAAREQALRLADDAMAFRVPTATYQDVLQKVCDAKLPIMIFVGNEGIIQIHTGEVEKIVEARGWFNVLDERFNLHIKQDEIASAWIVKKPTADGIVSSLEIFNAEGENIALLFGRRKPGISEQNEWRELLATFKAI